MYWWNRQALSFKIFGVKAKGGAIWLKYKRDKHIPGDSLIGPAGSSRSVSPPPAYFTTFPSTQLISVTTGLSPGE